MDHDLPEGPLYVVGLRDATEEFIQDINSAPNPTIPLDSTSLWLDSVLETMMAHFEYKAVALDSYRSFLFSEDVDHKTENERIERAAHLESLVEFGKKVFSVLEQNGMYSDDGELLGKYLQVHGDYAVVLCHYPDSESWRQL